MAMLRIETDSLSPIKSNHDVSPSAMNSPTFPTSPSFHLPLSPNVDKSSPSAQLARLALSHRGSANHAREESKKLVGLLLDRLSTRTHPPPILDALNLQATLPLDQGFRQIAGAVRVKQQKSHKRGASVPISQFVKEDSDDEGSSNVAFSSEPTFDLMVQLKEVLLFSSSQGWQIFEQGASGLSADTSMGQFTKSSPFSIRSSMRRSSISGRRSRSPSPSLKGNSHAPSLLSLCISILSSVISEDCRFQISSPRPSKPPNALQAVCLDIAQFLAHVHSNEPSVVSRIAFAVLPAFGTFRSEMHARLLDFFNNAILVGIFEDLNRLRGRVSTDTSDEVFGSHGQANTVSIQVEMALDDDDNSSCQTASWQPWTSLASTNTPIQAANAPLQPLAVYYLASIIAPLLAAIVEHIDIISLPPTYSLCRLLDTIVSSKPDSYLDVLEVIAYHVPQSRRPALCLLATFWPRALGHVVISKAIPILGQWDQNWNGGIANPPLEPGTSCPHDFVPWKFRQSHRSSTCDETSSSVCQSCASPITEFGLLCCGCMCAVHFDCYDYPQGNVLHQYAMASDSGTQKLAVHRFCLIPPSQHGPDLVTVKPRHNHDFQHVNLFTLPICFHCCQPIWGCQALHCVACKLFVHFTCLNQPFAICGTINISSIQMMVSLDSISRTFADYYSDIFLASEDLGKRSFEEISVSFAVLWTQLQIYNNGLALGSFVLASEGHEDQADGFELQYLVELYEAYLSSGKLPVSAVLGEYLEANRHNSSSLAIMFDWSTLAYISSTIKSSYDVQNLSSSSSADLCISAENVVVQDGNDAARHPFEVVTLAHLRDSLGYEFNMLSEGPARHCLSHLHKLGFFTCTDFPLCAPQPAKSTQLCHFPLPLGFDLSTSVETLVSAIEACFSDVDLSVNEFGFLLMVRRFWPSGLASEYALRRLSHATLSWIFAEDDSLTKILRDFIPREIDLPGVRSTFDIPVWPVTHDTRRAPTSSANNGGDYVAARRLLLSRYAAQWLLALHDQDVVMYARLLSEIIRDIASDLENSCLNVHEPSLIAERSLHLIIRLCQASVHFTALDDLFLVWLRTLEAEVLDTASLSSLERLLDRDAAENAPPRHSTFVDQILAQVDGHVVKLSDPWGMVRRAAKQNELLESLRWLRLFARSGVDINLPIFAEYSEMSRKGIVTLKQGSVFAETSLLSAWTRSMGRQDLQKSISIMLASLQPSIQDALRSSGDAASCALIFIRQSLATCLLLYGCDRAMLVSNGMISEEDIRNVPSKRKQNTRVAHATDPIIIDSRLMLVLSTLVATGMEQIVCLISKFLYSFVMHASLVEAHEVDNFVLRNGNTLYPCIWHFYGIQHHEIASIRTTLFLRVLIVDSQSFHEFVSLMSRPTEAWDIRLLTLDRIFRMTLDIISPEFVVEHRPWKHSVVDFFYYAFEPLWMDEKEEVRISVDTWLQTLLAAHLDAIASCWNDAFPSLPVSKRLRLVSFLLQLQSHFPTWRVLSWSTIIETLLEYDYLQNNGNGEDGPAAAHLEMYGLNTQNDVRPRVLDMDIHSIQTSIALLGLRMMKNGVEIDITSCMKFKLYLARILGFSGAQMVSSLNGRAYSIHLDAFSAIPRQCLPCVNEFAGILDAPHPFDLPPSLMNSSLTDDDKPCRVLIGSIWIDVVLGAFCAMEKPLKLPALTFKSLLEALMTMIYKHDFDSPALRHLDVLLRRALKKILNLLLVDLSYDSRHVSLSVIETYIKRGSAISGILVIESVERAVALIALLKHNAEDMLVIQAKSFIENTLITLAPSGVFCSLCKRPLSSDFFTVIRSIVEDQSRRASSTQNNLREVLLQSVVTQSPDADWEINHNIALNIKEYTESIYFEGLSKWLIKDVITWLVMTARRASTLGNDAGFDPNLLLYISTTLLQHNKTHAEELLECTEMVLRVALSRSNVEKHSLIRALHAVTSLSDTSLSTRDSVSSNANHIAQILMEILEDVFRARARVTPLTLNAVVETILCSDVQIYSSPDRAGTLRQVACSGLHFLQDHVWMISDTSAELSASIVVSRLVFHAIDVGHSSLSDMIAEGFEKSIQAGTVVRAWNILLLSVLSGPTDMHIRIFIEQLRVFVPAYYKCLGAYVHGRTTPSESAVADVEHAFIALKLWLLLAQMPLADSTRTRETANVKVIWNELWPPLEALVNLFTEDSMTGDYLPLAMTIWSSVASLFLFVLQSRSPVGLDTIPHTAMLNSLRDCGTRNSALSKLSRALDGEFLPDLLPSAVIGQAKKDIENAEKLRVLESAQRPVERRRDMRFPILALQ